jgi:signal transduction histidine kinase
MENWKEKFLQLNEELNTIKKKHVDFLEAASHDLHAPLRKISIFIDRVAEKNNNGGDPATMEYISRIKNSIFEMQRLVDNLSSLAVATSSTIQTADCDLSSIVRQTILELKEQIEEKKTTIHFPVLPIVEGDPVQYKQLFLNIFENAVKFSKKDVPLEIDIKCNDLSKEEIEKHQLTRNAGYYKIVIADNGIGFASQYAEKIFEPFVRLHAKSDYPGTGLGLSIAKKIVANHNGIIYAEGNEHVGARFILILPANL